MAVDTFTETLPHSYEAERAVIGAVLLDNTQYHKARELLSADSFYSRRHQLIFGALENVLESGSAADLLTLKAELDRLEHLDACGGPAFLAELLDGVPRSANVEHYARIVREKQTLRQLVASAQQILSAAVQPDGSTPEILDEAEKSIFRVAQDQLRSGFLPLKTIAEESLQHIEELTERRELVTGVATGFPQLDEMTAGLQRGDLVVLAARPSMGKTAFALNMAAHAAMRQAKTVGVFSLEMSHQQLFLRMLCSEGMVDAHRLRTGRVNNEDWQRIIKTYAELSESPVFIDDTPGVGVMEMRAKTRRLKLEHGLDLLIVDYLQLMRGRGRYDSRQQEISDISRSLKELAKELQVPIVALSQLSRAPEQRGGDHRPQLSDLRESGAIEQDADVVLFLFREEVYRKDDPELKGKAELIIGKQRNGPVGVVHLNFVRDFTKFAVPEYREF